MRPVTEHADVVKVDASNGQTRMSAMKERLMVVERCRQGGTGRWGRSAGDSLV